jgi:hypothetical protein
MKTNSARLSRLMKMSWDIQRTKSSSRSKSLQAAWVIFSNEDTTVHYLVQRLNHHRPLRKEIRNQMALFPG